MKLRDPVNLARDAATATPEGADPPALAVVSPQRGATGVRENCRS